MTFTPDELLAILRAIAQRDLLLHQNALLRERLAQLESQIADLTPATVPDQT